MDDNPRNASGADDLAVRQPVGGKDAGYLLEFRGDGAYLTVYPSDDQGVLFELSDIGQILEENGVKDYDVVQLSRCLREAAGVPRRLTEHYEGQAGAGEEEEPYAKIIVEVSRDRMQATVKYDTEKGRRLPDEQMVAEALLNKKVIFGIDKDAIAKGVQSLEPFVAARGIPAQNGTDAYIDKKFDLGIKGRPVIDEFDRVDYKNMNLFVLVKAGSLLAVRVPQTEGKAGRDVLGNEVHARNGKPIPMPNGKNTKVVGENELVATIDGQIVEKGKKIEIDSHLAINSDVGVGTGDIDFDGSVTVKGNVDAGFTVKATGDIEIKGMVSGADIRGRNIIIGGGVTGMNRGKVAADEDVRAAFAENAIIEAGRDIYIADVSLHSTLTAGKHVIIEEKRGLINGGSAMAGEEIRAKVVGNQAFVVTRLSVGIDPQLQRQYNENCKEYKENRQRLTQITQMLNTLGKIDVSKLPPQRIDQINALTRSQFPLAGKLKRLEKAIKKIEAELEKMRAGKIRVSDVIYPGTNVMINSVAKNVQSEIKHCTLSVKDDNVDIGPY